MGEFTALQQSPLPALIKRAVALPLGSTYSPGMGLVYSVIYGLTPDYESFMSVALVVTLLLLHASALMLYGAMVRVGIRPGSALCATLLFLFSISIYAYGFHLGSTIWAIASLSLFLYGAASLSPANGWSKRLGLLAAGLVFFNYLIVIPYVGLLALACLHAWSDRAYRAGAIFASGWKAAKSQFIPLSIIAVCAVIFFQPGQGIRGRMGSWGELPSYLYNIGLDFVAWTNQGGVALGLLQLVIGAGLFGFGLVSILKGMRSGKLGWFDVRMLCMATLSVYVIFILLGLLNLSPSRHILFIAPIVFLVMAVGIDHLRSLWLPRIPAWVPVAGFALMWVCAQFLQQQRFEQMHDPSLAIIPPGGMVAAFAYDGGDTYIRRNALPRIRKLADMPAAPGQYLYVSQTKPYEQMIGWLRGTDPALASRFTFIRSIASINPEKTFTAMNPQYGDDRFAYNRPNGFFLSIFKVD